MNMTDEKITDKVQAVAPTETAVLPEEKSKIVYEGGGSLARGQRTVSYTHLTLPTIYSV